MLYEIVGHYVPSFFAHVSEEDASLPAFVHVESERYLRCGRLEEGVDRVVCTGCRHRELVQDAG